jgi:serine/threonine protein phosphatase PrpC
MEAYGATRKMSGEQNNEDAFTIIRDPAFIVAVADGSGRAYGIANRALAFLTRMVRNTEVEMLKYYATWEGIAKALDAYLAGGKETTLVAATVIGEGVYGIQVGDSRCYIVKDADQYLNSVASDTKKRLGSGECLCSPIHLRLKEDEYLIFATDGAWTAFDRLSLQRAKREAQHFSDIPTLLLQQILKAGRGHAADDMTIVVVRR